MIASSLEEKKWALLVKAMMLDDVVVVVTQSRLLMCFVTHWTTRLFYSHRLFSFKVAHFDLFACIILRSFSLVPCCKLKSNMKETNL